ncbi:unnamed protein product [Victoria cruziana]
MAFRSVAAAAAPPTIASLQPSKPSTNPSGLPSISTATPLLHRSIKFSKLAAISASSHALIAAASVPNAIALTKDDIITSLTKVENAVEQAQETASTAITLSRDLLDGFLKIVKPGVDVAVPLIQKAGDEAIRIASPAVSEAAKQAGSALQGAGFDPEPVLSAAKTMAENAGGAAEQTGQVLEQVKPIASATVETLSSSDPSTFVLAAGAVLLTSFILPPIGSAISFSLRGYKGDLSPAQTLDLICSQDHLLIDIRSEMEKNKAGIPRLPSSAKNKLISVPLEELPSKIRSIVRNSKKVEAEIAALKISYLKRVNRGTNIVIMDSYSDTSKTVAKLLTGLGFKNCWVLADGFSGGRGWLQSRLGTDSYNLSFAEVLSPSRVIPAAVRNFGTVSLRSQPAGKLLPGGAED